MKTYPWFINNWTTSIRLCNRCRFFLIDMFIWESWYVWQAMDLKEMTQHFMVACYLCPYSSNNYNKEHFQWRAWRMCILFNKVTLFELWILNVYCTWHSYSASIIFFLYLMLQSLTNTCYVSIYIHKVLFSQYVCNINSVCWSHIFYVLGSCMHCYVTVGGTECRTFQIFLFSDPYLAWNI